MRRLLVSLATVLMIMTVMPAAFAGHNAGPCNSAEGDGNSNYALHHIVVETPGHVPGFHGGFSVCLGTGRSVHKP